ncbi:MAG TPA: preprotein translocase subunit SecE [Acidiferrobacteraceae bacterium]|nr:preprotein translocase subunit SecE [Acidiferrobacteraceae bacterium]HEX19728.1 preprotein translocase subunit SecE [Acidiferrobacteraceae bacterium]
MDKLRLTGAVLALAVGIVAFYYFDTQAQSVRVLMVVGATIVAALVAMTSGYGKRTWEFAKTARLELRKVVWPGYKETMQMTIIVFVLVLLIALFLWGVDWMLLKGVKVLTGAGKT